MVSYMSLRFYLNAAFEAISILLLVCIVFACMFKKTKNNTEKDFSLLVFTIICLLTENAVTWVLSGMLVSKTLNTVLFNIGILLTVVDFFLNSFTCVMFLNYILAITGLKNQYKKKCQKQIRWLTVYCFITTAVFSTSLPSGWLLSISDAGYIHYSPIYSFFLVLSIPALWLSYIIVFKKKDMLKKETFLLLAYLFIPLLLTVVDQIFNLSTGYISLAFIILSIYISVDIKQDRNLLIKETEIERRRTENTEMNVKLMVSQIQPHFLYNTLGTIYQLCGKDAKIARKTIKNFTKYLRANMESLNKTAPISFEKELEHTKAYLSIELLRFSEKLNVEYAIECSDFAIPALSLQPLVENAVNHGIRSRAEGGTVKITTKRENGKIYISVQDDGLGFDTTRLPRDGKAHIGISNVRKRLEYMVGGSLQIESKKNIGTTATIILEDTKNELAAY